MGVVTRESTLGAAVHKVDPTEFAIYAAAIDSKRYTATSMVNDSPEVFKPRKPQNQSIRRVHLSRRGGQGRGEGTCSPRGG